eukprot:8897539-Pyramimonas_sp.AAC.1
MRRERRGGGKSSRNNRRRRRFLFVRRGTPRDWAPPPSSGWASRSSLSCLHPLAASWPPPFRLLQH